MVSGTIELDLAVVLYYVPIPLLVIHAVLLECRYHIETLILVYDECEIRLIGGRGTY